MSKKILLADDSITIHKVISITFADEDFDLKIVSDGDSAVAEAQKFLPDLVMADVSMPGKSGYEVCETIKSDPRLSHTPVLILAGTFEPIDAEELKRVGADDCIVKPFESQELIDKVQNLLEKNADSGSAVGGEAEETALEAEDSELPVVEDLAAEPPDAWDERDFIIAETVEEKSQPVELSGDDALDGVTAEGIAEEPEKEELRQIVAEEFEELDLSGGDVETIEELEEIKEVEEVLEEEEADASIAEAESEEEPLAFEPALPDTTAPEPLGDGEAETLSSEPDSEAEAQREEPQDIPVSDIEGDGSLSSDGLELSTPWLSEVGDVEEDREGADHSEAAETEEHGTGQPGSTCEVESEEAPEEAAEVEAEEKIRAPWEDVEPAVEPAGAEDSGEVDERGATDEVLSFESPVAEAEDTEEPLTFAAAPPELNEAESELAEPIEIAEEEVETESAVEAVESSAEAEQGGEEAEPEGEAASAMGAAEPQVEVESVAPSGDEVEPPLDVEAEQAPSCDLVESAPEPEMEMEPETDGLSDDGAGEERAPDSESSCDTKLEEDEEEDLSTAEAVAAPVMDREKLEEIVARVARSVLEEVAWEVVPEMAAEMVKEELRKSREAAKERE